MAAATWSPATTADGRDGANGAYGAGPSNGYGANGTNRANRTNGDDPVGPPAMYAPKVRRAYMRAGVILGRDYTRPPDDEEP